MLCEYNIVTNIYRNDQIRMKQKVLIEKNLLLFKNELNTLYYHLTFNLMKLNDKNNTHFENELKSLQKNHESSLKATEDLVTKLNDMNKEYQVKIDEMEQIHEDNMNKIQELTTKNEALKLNSNQNEYGTLRRRSIDGNMDNYVEYNTKKPNIIPIRYSGLNDTNLNQKLEHFINKMKYINVDITNKLMHANTSDDVLCYLMECNDMLLTDYIKQSIYINKNETLYSNQKKLIKHLKKQVTTMYLERKNELNRINDTNFID